MERKGVLSYNNTFSPHFSSHHKRKVAVYVYVTGTPGYQYVRRIQVASLAPKPIERANARPLYGAQTQKSEGRSDPNDQVPIPLITVVYLESSNSSRREDLPQYPAPAAFPPRLRFFERYHFRRVPVPQ
jgi:hypothetical protein